MEYPTTIDHNRYASRPRSHGASVVQKMIFFPETLNQRRSEVTANNPNAWQPQEPFVIYEPLSNIAAIV